MPTRQAELRLYRGCVMGFERDRLPDAESYYTAQGLRLTGNGKWRTTECRFHGGSDSMRINLANGAFVCMASCGARGGDVLAYHMAENGLDFVTAAKALGAWIDDGTTSRTTPTPLPARDAIQILATESNLVAIAAANVAHGVKLTSVDLDRVLTAANRITRIGEMFA